MTGGKECREQEVATALPSVKIYYSGPGCLLFCCWDMTCLVFQLSAGDLKHLSRLLPSISIHPYIYGLRPVKEMVMFSEDGKCVNGF